MMKKTFPITLLGFFGIALALFLLLGCTGRESIERVAPPSMTQAIADDTQKKEDFIPKGEETPAQSSEDNTMNELKSQNFSKYILFHISENEIMRDDVHGQYAYADGLQFGLQKVENKEFYSLLDPQSESKLQAGEIFSIYRDEKFIGQAELIILSDESYALKFNDPSIIWEKGKYLAILGKWEAVPRSIHSDGSDGLLEVDLNGNSQMTSFEIRTEQVMDAGSERTKINLYINNEFSMLIGLPFDRSEYDPSEYTKDELDMMAERQEPYLGAYDLDNDGRMEILLYTVWPGGDSFEIFHLEGAELEKLFGWNSEEEPWYIDTAGRKYYYDGNEKTYYKSVREEPKDEAESKITESSSTKPEASNIETDKVQNQSGIFRNIMQEAKNIYYKLEARKVEVLGQNERTEADFWHRLYSGFQMLNSVYADEKESVLEGLKDLSWHDNQGFAVFIWNADKLMQDDLEAREGVLSLLDTQVIEHWKGKEGRSFSVYLASDEE